MSIESRKHQYGTVFDHWQIKNTLGEGSGGKSAVFQLVHTSSPDVKSALKVISLIDERGNKDTLSAARRADYESARKICKENAEKEVLLMNDLQGNTNVVDYLDHTFVDWSDDTGFGCDLLIRMELLTDLRSEIQSDKEFNEEDVLKIGRDVCQALVLCHSKNILHRDIKPENIFKNKDSNYKLGDFGVSRIMSSVPMSMASTSIGTPEYAAPEQFSGMHDLRIDIYSLGLVLYELCNGKKLPFASSSYITQQEVQMRQMGTPIPAPSNASESLTQVILKACAFTIEQRYQTAQELLDDLNAVANKMTPMAATHQPTYETLPAQNPQQTGYATMPAGVIPNRAAEKPQSGKQDAVNVSDKSANKSPKKKSSRGKLILFSIVGVLLAVAILIGALLAGVLFVIRYNSPEQKILRALEAEDYDTALSIYDNEMDGKDSAVFVDALKKRIETAKENFVSEILSYESTVQELDAIDKMNVSSVEETLSEVRGEIDALNNSRAAFKTAESFFATKNYPSAIEYYRQVIEADSNYEAAVNKLSDAENTYRQEILKKAAEYAAEKLYTEAILELDTGLQHLPDDTDLIAQKKVYQEDYAEQLRAEALTKAEEYAQTGDYANAVKVIQNALENDPDNAKLKAAYQKYSDAFIADEIAKADELIADYDFDGAIAILKAALKILPEDSTLADKLQLIEANKPVALTSIHVVDSLFYETGSGSDTFGNSYDNTISVGSYNLRSGYVIYNLNGKYDTLQFTIAASSFINGYTYDDPDEIKIYADDVLIYTKKLDLTTPPETVTLEIPNCKVLKIERGDERNLGNRLPLIADPIVFKINME